MVLAGVALCGAVLFFGWLSYIWRRTLGVRLVTGISSSLCFAISAWTLLSKLAFGDPAHNRHVSVQMAFFAGIIALNLDVLGNVRVLMRMTRKSFRRRKGHSRAIVHVMDKTTAKSSSSVWLKICWASTVLVISIIVTCAWRSCVCYPNIRFITHQSLSSSTVTIEYIMATVSSLYRCVTAVDAAWLVVLGIVLQWLFRLTGILTKRRLWWQGHGPIAYLCFFLVAHKVVFTSACRSLLDTTTATWYDMRASSLPQRMLRGLYTILWTDGLESTTTGVDSFIDITEYPGCYPLSQEMTAIMFCAVLAVELLLYTVCRGLQSTKDKIHRAERHNPQSSSTGGIRGLAKKVVENKAREPLFVECKSGKGGVQGVSGEKHMFKDEDGDLGHEFFKADATDVSRLVRVNFAQLKKVS
eukprot:Lankesteria_metandrocarpae@DN1533_c0_g1_i1.p1